MSRLFVLIIFLTGFATLYAQSHMRIHHKGGGHSDVAIEEIDSITFFDGSEMPDSEGILVGSWLWGDAEAGYYELLTFKEDKTYSGYDNYFTYGFDTMTYGWYMQMGSMLTLQSNGFGYKRRYNWYVTALTENALEAITRMGTFIYYKLQPEVIRLQEGNTFSYEGEDTIVFVDGVITKCEGNNLISVTQGVTNILKKESLANTIYAYKVIIE